MIRSLFALSDLHLGRDMSVFGEEWRNHPIKIAGNWRETVQPEDIVIIPGDICWALSMPRAMPYLRWLDDLPGVKILGKGITVIGGVRRGKLVISMRAG